MTSSAAIVIVFSATCAGLAWLIGSAIWSIVRPEQRAWPPVRREGLVFHVTGLLALAINVELVALAVLGWDSFVFDHWLRFPIGGALLAGGGYLGLGGYLALGARQSQGLEGGLVESGPYRFSRNPQYVGAILGFVGLEVLCNSALGLAAALLASVWFLLLPFAEEPWMRETLGAPYEDYVSRVPRYLPFFGMGRRGE